MNGPTAYREQAELVPWFSWMLAFTGAALLMEIWFA